MVGAAGVGARQQAGEWPVYGGDPGGRKYSTLTGITRENVAQLKVAWEWKPGEKAMQEFGTLPGAFQNTPLMIDGVLYVSTPYNQVVALDAATGKEICGATIRSPTKTASRPTARASSIAAWSRGAIAAALRIFLNARYKLICSTPRPARR